MFVLLELLWLSLVGFDAWVTLRQLKDFGPDVERNPIIRWLAKHAGNKHAVLIGRIIPGLAWGSLAAIFKLYTLLAMADGAGIMLALLQAKLLLSMRQRK